MDTSTLYWINVSTMYFVGIAFFILGLSELFNPKQNFKSLLILFVSFFYVGCSSEHVSVLVLGFLLIIYILQKKFNFFNSQLFVNQKLILAFIFCLISFIVMFLAPGNSVRLSVNTSPSIERGLMNIPTYFNILYFNRLNINYGYLIFAFFFSFSFGSFYSSRFILNKHYVQKIFLLFGFLLFYFVIGTFSIFSFLLDYKGSTRAFVHVSTIILLFVCFLGIVFGFYVNVMQQFYLYLLSSILIFVYGSTILFKYKFNLKPTLNYESSVHNRLTFLKKYSQSDEIKIIIPELLNDKNNILLNGELASDKNDKSLIEFNKCLNGFFDLKDREIILVQKSR